jgi:thioredoxin reductase
MTTISSKTVAIVGGGPVGALSALYFAKYFSKVILYELRPGIPTPTILTKIPGFPRIGSLF